MLNKIVIGMTLSLCTLCTPIFLSAQGFDQCSNDKASEDEVVRSCTAVIESGRWSGKDLTDAFHNRGRAYLIQRDYDRAIQDFNNAIRVNPQFAPAFDNRA